LKDRLRDIFEGKVRRSYFRICSFPWQSSTWEQTRQRTLLYIYISLFLVYMYMLLLFITRLRKLLARNMCQRSNMRELWASLIASHVYGTISIPN